jgi:hypothetical protein
MLQTGRYPTHSGIILNYVEASDVQNPHCMANVFGEQREVMQHLRSRMSELLQEAHDDFRPGTGYVGWFDQLRNLVATGLGPVARDSRSSARSLRRGTG